MEKTASDDGEPPTFGDHSDLTEDRLPGHYQFRQRFSEAFIPRGEAEKAQEEKAAAKEA
jgi:tRNA (guanine10-N2)-methyltransferase